jgi:hypothetical protein
MYPVGTKDVFMYANMYNDSVFVNIRLVKDGKKFTKEGISLNAWELNAFQNHYEKLKKSIGELQSGYKDFFIGKYKKVRWCADGRVLEFAKINDAGDSIGESVYLLGPEAREFFDTFAVVKNEFDQMVRDAPIPPANALPKRKTTDPATSSKRKASAPGASTIKKRVAKMQKEGKVPALKVDLS